MKGKMLKNIIIGAAFVLGLTLINPISSSAAWKQDSTGWWNTEGNSYSTGWKQIDGSWYYFGSDGYMKTGWANDNGSWYYLNTDGSMKTGWINDNGSWYYTNTSGAMQTGWINDNGSWYYTNESGAMQTGLISINDSTYYLNESGAMVTGDITLNGVKYTFAQTGEKITTNTTIVDNTTTDKTTDTTEETIDKVTSGGGGGGGGKAPESTTSDFCSYSDLYGTWTIAKYIDNSGMSSDLDGLLINSAIKQRFTVSKDEIKYNSEYYISNPKVNESILTNEDFKNKWGVNLSNLGINDSTVKRISITGTFDNNTYTVDVIVTKNNTVYAIVKNTPFKLSK